MVQGSKANPRGWGWGGGGVAPQLRGLGTKCGAGKGWRARGSVAPGTAPALTPAARFPARDRGLGLTVQARGHRHADSCHPRGAAGPRAQEPLAHPAGGQAGAARKGYSRVRKAS